MRIDTSLACIGLPVRGILSSSGAAPTPAPGPVPLTKLVAEGDSITFAEGSYARLWADANPGVAFANYATSGDGVADLNSRLSAMMAAEDPSHLTVLIGTNDMNGGGFATTQDYVDAVLDYVAAAKAIKPTLVVGVAGILPVGDNWWAAIGFNARRAEYNALMRAEVGAGIDFYIPLGDHPQMEDAAAEDLSLFSDEVHPTPAGYAILAAVYAAVMDGILAEDTGATPDVFALTDSGVELDEVYRTDTGPITGMAMGQTAVASLTGDGTFTRGNTDTGNPFGTDPQTVIVGDVCVVEVAGASTPETETEATLTIGGVSDTVTVETPGESALATTFRGYAGPNAGVNSANNPTFTDPVTYYAGLNIIGLFTRMSAGIPSSITLDGTTVGTPLAAVSSGASNTWALTFWAVPKAAGGEGDLSFIASGVSNFAYAHWSTDANAELASSQSVAWQAFGASPAMGGPITLPAGGSILAVAAVDPLRTLDPISGFTELADIDAITNTRQNNFWAGSRLTTGNIGLAYSGGAWVSGLTMLAIALQP